MEYSINGIKSSHGKVIYDLIAFYWLNSRVVTCKWKNTNKPDFWSNNKYFLYIEGLLINNDRLEQDKVYIRDNQFEGIKTDHDYPSKE